VAVCGVLLAAGAGSRFVSGEHKLLARLHGRAVWQHSLDHLLAAGLDEAVVVTGAVDLPLPAGVRHCPNPQWAAGQATSLLAGLAAADELGADAVVVGLADQPFVTSGAWAAMAASPCRVAVATYAGVRGPHPVRLAREVWPLLAPSGDEGARDLIRHHPEWVCEVPCLGSAADIDTLEDLERWKSC
jgi:CTP:molybdopterin cytidylyltransferase MocA